ncbi:hypothetical protein [Mangrovicoccus sp. HB161399]|uniref:hypothetical protein n=1 Tax=Mangrovicoccus sp. HB161399 TaxID=2720392 RepID=UPI0015567972|nr:hypothetical protein [Mangrovicoccus sp. HB161399]
MADEFAAHAAWPDNQLARISLSASGSTTGMNGLFHAAAVLDSGATHAEREFSDAWLASKCGKAIA